MVGDLISRQAALDKFEPWLKVKGYSEGELNMLKAVLYELKVMPSAQQWIPVTERLPEEEKAYLVTFANEKVGMSSWHKNTLYNRGFDAYLTGVMEDGECEYFGVVAWMEKPKPWKGGPDEH